MKTPVILSPLLALSVSSPCFSSPFNEWIQVSEIMYHPPGGGEEAEFIELVNTGPRAVDLSRWCFTEGISFTFPTGVFLAPREYLAVCKNSSLLQSMYGTCNCIGDYEGFLDNAGEPLVLVDAEGRQVVRLRYDDDGDWPEEADGEGSSLERIFFQHDPDWAASFRASRVLGGTPGRENSASASVPPGTSLTPCRLNEALVRPTFAQVELFNPGGQAADCAGLLLVPDALFQYGVSLSGVSVPPGGYVVEEMNLEGMASQVLRIFLVEEHTRVLVDVLQLGPAGQQAAFARYPDGSGKVWRAAQATLGAPNAYDVSPSLVVSEIYYHPPGGDDQLEWIELCNASSEQLDLTGWRLSKGVTFPFPAGTALRPGQSVVVAADPARFEAEYGFQPLGPFEGGLRDSNDRIKVRDAHDALRDDVFYADDGMWPSEADGGGKSLQRLHPGMPGKAPGSWRASAEEGGSPGRVAWADPHTVAPAIYGIRNEPGVPVPGQPATVRGYVACPGELAALRIHWQRDGSDTFQEADCTVGPEVPLRGRAFSAVVPAQPGPTVIAFFIHAETVDGLQGRFPETGEALFACDAEGDATDTVTFRIVMRASHWHELRSRSVWSDVFLPCTLVYRGKPYYDARMRFRGRNARRHEPKSYRVDPGHHNNFPLGRQVVLNAQRHEDQRLGLDLLSRSGIPAPRSRFVEVVTDEGHRRDYLQVEMINEDFLRRVFPNDADDGNLYRGDNSADLTYRGEDPNRYRGAYDKKTNAEEDDWTDLITLCRTLSDPELFQSDLAGIVAVPEWAAWYGVMAILNNEENSLANDRGDDYFIYSDSKNGTFWLLPWDLDTILDTPTEPLFRPTLHAVRRFLTWPPAARMYTETIVRELNSHARPDVLAAHLAPAAAFDPDPEEVAKLRDNARTRASFLDSAVPKELRCGIDASESSALIGWNGTWKYFKGRSDPAPDLAWTAVDFDDDSWQTGEGGFGYGDNDDRTLLADMRGRYSAVYLRKAFQVPDPTAVQSLHLAVWIDDGFVAYLNGTEVGRFNAGHAGEVLSHTAVAERSIEPVERSIAIPNAAELLRAGTNVLALLGLNANLRSGDFSLDAQLSAGRGGEAYGWADVVVSPPGRVRLYGIAPPYLTAEVRVNDDTVPYDVLTFRWETHIDLRPGPNLFSVELYDEELRARLTKTLTVYATQQVQVLSGTVSTQQVVTEAGGPAVITDPVVVEQGGLLSFQAGSVVFLGDGGALTVRGTVTVEGTYGEPVRFLPAGEGARSGGIAIEEGGTLRCRYLSAEEIGAPQASLFELTGGNLTLRACRFRTLGGSLLSSHGGEVVLCDVTSTDCEGGISLEDTEFSGSCILIEDWRNGYALAAAGGTLSLRQGIFRAGPRGLRLQSTGELRGLLCEHIETESLSVGSGSLSCYCVALLQSAVGLSVGEGAAVTLDHATIGGCSTAADIAAGASVAVIDSICWYNGATFAGGGSAAANVRYSTFPEALPEEGNSSSDPLFYGGPEGRWSLRAESPCLGSASDGTARGAFPEGPLHPALLSISPAEGPFSGNSLLVARGTGFTPVSTVLLGGTPAVETTFVDSETVTARTPPHAGEGTETVTLWTLSGPAQNAHTFTYRASLARGDANGSGAVDISDAVFLLRYLYGFGPAPPCASAGDVTHDGRSDIADVVALLSYLFAGGPAPQPAQAGC